MEEFEGIIKEVVSIDGVDFYLVEDVVSLDNYYVPKSKIDNLWIVEFGVKMPFLREFNLTNKRNYISLLIPKYKVGRELFLTVRKRDILNGKIILELESEFYPSLTVLGNPWQEDFSEVLCRVVGFRRGLPKLRNIDQRSQDWPKDAVYSFKIKGYGDYADKKGKIHNALIIETSKGEEIKVKANIWHSKELWKFDDIRCKVIGVTSSGLPKLIVVDSRHPIYEKGRNYFFYVIQFERKKLNSGSEIEVIKLRDETHSVYEVSALPNQRNKLNIDDKLECEVIDIGSNLFLRQVNIDDPFFYPFEEIVDDRNLYTNYFERFLNPSYTKFYSQYTQKSAFWVFTYCNSVLIDLKNSAIKRRSLNELLEIILLHSKVEEWILNKGILQAIIDDLDRKRTKAKISKILNSNRLQIEVIEYILEFKEDDFFLDQRRQPNLQKLFYFLEYSNFESIDEIQILKILNVITYDYDLNTESFYYVNRIKSYINKYIPTLRASFYQYYFILSKDLNDLERKNILKYINWSLVELKLSKLGGNNFESNLVLSRIYRTLTLLSSDYSNNKKLLLNAFYIISNVDVNYDLPFDMNVEAVISHTIGLPVNPNVGDSLDLSRDWHSTLAKSRHYRGYKLYINDLQGFLPYQNITDPTLRRYTGNLVDWTLNVSVTLYCNDFKYFIAKQMDCFSDFYYSKNNLLEDSNLIDVIDLATVQNTTDYGVFVNTKYGDGLIHLSNISYEYFDKSNIPLYFKKGDQIPVYINGLNADGLILSLKDLIGTEYEKKYFDIFELFSSEIYEEVGNEEKNIDFLIELEKGFIFEQYASIQQDFDAKIKYIKFAKAFFSNTKNARSYLLNIYLEYFNSIIQLDNLIADYSFEKYVFFKKEILKIKEKLDPKTLENFPESKSLLFFIDILNLFNSQNEADLEVLFDLMRQSIRNNDDILKTLAKGALANNLIISEINPNSVEELNEFTLKNLKTIRQYINQGVLSVKETVEDRLAKEMKEKRSYWLERIKLDEGESLEFKSTFITPVPSKDNKRIIESLEKRLIKASNEKERAGIIGRIESLVNMENDQTKGLEKKIIHSALKTICAFANTNGGVLLLGVSDDKSIFGLERDYGHFKEENKRDSFGKYFDSMIKNYFGESFSSSLLEKEFLKFPEGDILIVKVNKSPNEIFLLKDEYGNKEESIYVRNLSSSEKLSGIELAKFIRNKLVSSIQNSGTSLINLDNQNTAFIG